MRSEKISSCLRDPLGSLTPEMTHPFKSDKKEEAAIYGVQPNGD